METLRPILRLEEYATKAVAQSEIAESAVQYLVKEHAKKIDVRAPLPSESQNWQLTSKGWVGFLPTGPGQGLWLAPRVPIRNVLGMFEWAWSMKFNLPDGLVESQSIHEVYDRLARVLAHRVLVRHRRGLARAYVPETERLMAARGRLDSRHLARPTMDGRLACRFKRQTVDIEDNRVLVSTLRRILRSGLCSEGTRTVVRKSFQTLNSTVQVVATDAAALEDRLYDRLNEDYRPLHALCRFFLLDSGPTITEGVNQSIPFLFYMPDLFEQFVTQWVLAHLPARLQVGVQEDVPFHGDGGTGFEIDLVFRDSSTGQVLAVADTKYKTSRYPKAHDVQQIVAYAAATRCREAVLIYPRSPDRKVDFNVGDVRVRALGFELSGDLDLAGARLFSQLALGAPRL